MQKIFFTAGPAQLYPTVTKHINYALGNNLLSISHRDKDFHEIYNFTDSKLHELLDIPKQHRIFFLSSATEAWERILQNTVSKNTFHFVNGAFSQKFFEFANMLGLNACQAKAESGESFNFENIKIPSNSELINLTHNETSTGVMLDMANIYQLKTKYPDKIISLDVVSSIPNILLNFSKLDLVYFSIQKGFGLPSGLGVLVVSPQALERSLQLKKLGHCTGTYRDFETLEQFANKSETPETPNILGIYLLGKICADILNYGIEKFRTETLIKYKMLEKVIENSKQFEYFVKIPTNRSYTSIVLKTKIPSSSIIRKLSESELVVSTGYGGFKDSHIRIGNYFTHSVEDFEILAKCLST